MYVDILEAIEKVVIDNFSQMGFIDVIPSKNSIEEIEDRITVQIDIIMPFYSSVYLAMPKVLVNRIGENLFSEIYEPESVEMAEDCASEFANTLVGKIFQVSTPNVLFELGIPKILKRKIIGYDQYDFQSFITEDKKVIGLAHKLKNMMSGEATPNEKIEIKNFREIDINKFFQFHKLDCDVFIRISEHKYLKIINKNQAFDHTLTDKYLKKGVEFFYIRDEDFEQFTEKFLNKVDEMMKNAEVTPEEKEEIQRAVFAYVSKQAQGFGVPGPVMAKAKAAMDVTDKMINKSKKLQDMLKGSVEPGNEMHKLCVLTSYITSGIVSSLEWCEQTSFEKLSMASMFHDITIKDIRLAMIYDLESDEFKSLTPDDQNVVKTHTLKAADIVREINDFPPDVDKIIHLHHEIPGELGFPLKVPPNNVIPIACVFIIGREFVNRVFGREPSKEELLEIIKEFEEKYNVGNFKRPLASFVTMVKSELL